LTNLPNLKSILRALLGSICSIHRLDKFASSAVQFAIIAEVHNLINLAFENREVKEENSSIVPGFSDWQTHDLSIPLTKNGNREYRTVFHA
jgi:23S rRNA-/tRNA-specific pseudouridylate synthase